MADRIGPAAASRLRQARSCSDQLSELLTEGIAAVTQVSTQRAFVGHRLLVSLLQPGVALSGEVEEVASFVGKVRGASDHPCLVKGA